MIESKTYQQQRERDFIESTIENTLALLEHLFPVEAVHAVRPALLRIDDLEKLEQLLLATIEVPDIDAFAQMLNE